MLFEISVVGPHRRREVLEIELVLRQGEAVGIVDHQHAA